GAGGERRASNVEPGQAVLCAKENRHLWALRQPPFDFGSNLIFHRPGGECPSRGRWKRFIDDLFELWFQPDPAALLVIDTAVSFMPLADRNKRVLRWALGQLSLVADSPAGVLVLNQSRNVHRPLAAFADIVIEMEIPRGDPLTRRRTFTGLGRYPETLQAAIAELTSDGPDSFPPPEAPAPPPPLPPPLKPLLAKTPTPLPRRELLARWPAPAPREDTLWRTLMRGVELGLFIVTGSG